MWFALPCDKYNEQPEQYILKISEQSGKCPEAGDVASQAGSPPKKELTKHFFTDYGENFFLTS